MECVTCGCGIAAVLLSSGVLLTRCRKSWHSLAATRMCVSQQPMSAVDAAVSGTSRLCLFWTCDVVRRLYL